MLHPYQEASNRHIPLDRAAEERIPGRELLSLLCGVNSWLGKTPSIQSSLQGKTVYVLYKNVAFLIDDFWESFGLTMADVQETWPICVFGTAQNQETIRLVSEKKADSVQLVQQSLSGKSTDLLVTLCFQIDCTDIQTAEKLIRLLTGINWQTNIAAMEWKDGDFLQEQGLVLDLNCRGLFCYAGIDTEITASDCLLSLNFVQKISLWTAFLKEGFEPVEFEWMADEISEDSISDRLEWKLSLRETMDQLHFHVVNQENSFALFDGMGKRLYFGADCRQSAERALIKILFPLNYQ